MISLIFSDLHIDEESIGELRETLKEIIGYKADNCIVLGDFYNKRHSTPLEISFGTEMIVKLLSTYGNVSLLTGNHEEIDPKMSSIDYLKYLGATIYSDEVIIDNNML